MNGVRDSVLSACFCSNESTREAKRESTQRFIPVRMKSRGLSEQIRLRQRADRSSRDQRREVRTAFYPDFA